MPINSHPSLSPNAPRLLADTGVLILDTERAVSCDWLLPPSVISEAHPQGGRVRASAAEDDAVVGNTRPVLSVHLSVVSPFVCHEHEHRVQAFLQKWFSFPSSIRLGVQLLGHVIAVFSLLGSFWNLPEWLHHGTFPSETCEGSTRLHIVCFCPFFFYRSHPLGVKR